MLYQLNEKEILLEYIESERYEAAREEAKEVAIQMLKDGQFSVEQIAKSFFNLSVEDVKKMYEELLQNV